MSTTNTPPSAAPGAAAAAAAMDEAVVARLMRRPPSRRAETLARHHLRHISSDGYERSKAEEAMVRSYGTKRIYGMLAGAATTGGLMYLLPRGKASQTLRTIIAITSGMFVQTAAVGRTNEAYTQALLGLPDSRAAGESRALLRTMDPANPVLRRFDAKFPGRDPPPPTVEELARIVGMPVKVLTTRHAHGSDEERDLVANQPKKQAEHYGVPAKRRHYDDAHEDDGPGPVPNLPGGALYDAAREPPVANADADADDDFFGRVPLTNDDEFDELRYARGSGRDDDYEAPADGSGGGGHPSSWDRVRQGGAAPGGSSWDAIRSDSSPSASPSDGAPTRGRFRDYSADRPTVVRRNKYGDEIVE